MRSLLLALALSIGLVPAQDKPASPLAIPASDDGLPGTGPIRRYDWFKSLWLEKRSAWAKRTTEDKGAVVFLGDSITQGWGDDFAGAFPGLKAANRGISGDTTRGMLVRLKEDVLDLSPAAVVLLMGTNDLEEKASPETIAANAVLLLDALKAHRPDLPIFLCEVFPASASKSRPAASIKAINDLYRKAASSRPQVTLIPTYALFANASGDAKPEEFPDLLHPNTAGYTKWASALTPALKSKGLLK